ncbi:MAG: hypothetical protein JRN68_02240 [Nitrososphaerota archaeon]|nr:hypothetical protein [Nitrososphaerota archaeon]
MEVFVTEAKMGSVAGFVKGYAIIEGTRIRFKGVAFGRYGGHNVVVTLMPSSVRTLTAMGLDAEQVELELQRSIVQGNFTPIPDAKHTGDPLLGPKS